MRTRSFSQRLATAWRALRDRPAPAEAADDTRALDAEAAAAGLRLEFAQAQQDAQAALRALEAEQAARSDAVTATVAARLEPALADAAATLAQLALQDRLLAEGKPVAAKDVLALARGLGRSLERLGLVGIGQPGENATFDSTIHQMLSGSAPAPGTVVVLRMPGYRLGEKVVRKAMVVLNP